mgnify:CR=1 FL=1
MSARLDLNADLGEGCAFDAELMSVVTSCNIACGGHAGDAASMRTALCLAKEKADTLGVSLTHLKPHGALYNMAAVDAGLTESVVAVLRHLLPDSALFGPPNSKLQAAAEAQDMSFVAEGFADRAYEDMPLPISCGQTISQPSVVGLMSQALDVQPRDKVLEIGTGSGYQAAVLSHLARRVYTIERHARLARAAQSLFTREGSRGYPEQAPFDRMLVTAAAEDPPGPLLAEVREGGIMVLPVGQSDTVQRLIKATRTETGYDYDELLPVRFVPLVEGMSQD